MPLTPHETLAFLAVCAGLALAPGPNLAVVLHSAARGGMRAASASAAGLTASKAAWAAASLVGLAGLLEASAGLHATLRLAGALYLAYLGATMLWSSRRSSPALDKRGGPPLGARAAARTGAVTDLLNPKVGAFYLAVFPQFIGPGDPAVLTAILLLALHALILMSYYPLVAWLSLRARDLAGAGGAVVSRLVGAGLLATGGALAAETLAAEAGRS